MEVPAEKKRVKASLSMWRKSGALEVVEGLDEQRKPKKYVVPGKADPFVLDEMTVPSADHKGV